MPDAPTSPRVLKARAVRDGVSQVAFNLEDVRAGCDAEIAAARKQAAAILEQARRDIDAERQKLIDESRQAGYDEGMKSAKEEIETRAAELARQWADEGLHSTLPAMQQVGKTLNRERARWLADWEAEVIRLAVGIAGKIVRREIAANPAISPELIREALQLVTSNARLRIRLHPDDAKNMGEFDRDIAGAMNGIADVDVIPDDSITPGGCIVETEHGRIDARIETQLQRITSELIGDGNSPPLSPR